MQTDVSISLIKITVQAPTKFAQNTEFYVLVQPSLTPEPNHSPIRLQHNRLHWLVHLQYRVHDLQSLNIVQVAIVLAAKYRQLNPLYWYAHHLVRYRRDIQNIAINRSDLKFGVHKCQVWLLLKTVDSLAVLNLPMLQQHLFFNDSATTEIYTLSLHRRLFRSN